MNAVKGFKIAALLDTTTIAQRYVKRNTQRRVAAGLQWIFSIPGRIRADKYTAPDSIGNKSRLHSLTNSLAGVYVVSC
jgi:hypothetical protein